MINDHFRYLSITVIGKDTMKNHPFCHEILLSSKRLNALASDMISAWLVLANGTLPCAGLTPAEIMESASRNIEFWVT